MGTQMTREEVKTRVQKLLTAKLPKKMDPIILYKGTPPKRDPEKLVLAKDLRLTVMDLKELAQDISEEFETHFPIGDAVNAATLGDLVDAVFEHIKPKVRGMLKPLTTMASPITRDCKRDPARVGKLGRTAKERRIAARRSSRRKKR